MSEARAPASIPSWLQALPDAAQMRAIDAWAIEQRGIPSLDLMERAGFGLARVVAEVSPGGRVAVVCGKGNNGGDGLVAARMLREDGREVDVLAVGALEEARGDVAVNLERLPGEAPRPFAPEALAGAGTVVDALLGTGFAGEVREPVRSAVEAINAAGALVVAADVPSGVDASTGEVAGAAVRAHATATFHAAKPGLWIAPGKAHAGAVHVIEIGIPPGSPVTATAGLIGPAVLGAVPRREAPGTKFSSGAVLLCGGSVGLTGAPCLAAEAAMRAGAGYVTAFVPASLNMIFEGRLLEVMTVPAPDADGALLPAAADHVLERAARADSLILGPGIGRTDGALALARDLARRVELALVLDADGLNAHAGRLGDLAGRPAPGVLTPHEGELARLLETESAAVKARRSHHAREAAATSGCVVVLKGDDTLVARPDGVVGVSRGGSPGLATAGTGDVLSGVLGALLAKHVEPFAAACAAVLVHAAAGKLAAEPAGPDGVIARDVIEALPAAIARERAAG